MYGYTRCPKCKKILFEEDIEKKGGNEQIQCMYCGEKMEQNNIYWKNRIMLEESR